MKKLYYLIFILVLINFSNTLFAEENNTLPGYKYLGNYNANPHEVEVYITPNDPKIGYIRLATKIKNLEDKTYINNAKVEIYLTNKDSGAKLYNLALNSPNDYVHYLSQFELEESGEWIIDLEVESDNGKSLTLIEFIASDEVRAGHNNIWGTLLFLFVCITFLAGIFWLKISSNRAKRRQN